MKIARNGNKMSLGKAEITLFSDVLVGDTKIDWPGEYQIDGLSIRAFDGGENGIAFTITTDGARVFFPARKPLAEEEINFEVLIIAAEESDFSTKEWKNFIEESEPRMAIFLGNGEKTNAVKREIGVAAPESAEDIDISAKKFSAEKTLFFAL